MLASLEFVKTTAAGIKHWFETTLASHNNDETAHHAATDADVLLVLAEENIIDPVVSPAGAVLTDNAGKVYVL